MSAFLFCFAAWLAMALGMTLILKALQHGSAGLVGMFLVGGSILVHGVPPLHHAIEHWAGLAGPASSVAAMLLDALVGIAGGALALLGVQGFGAVRKLAGGGRA